MRPALFYIPDAALRGGPSTREAEALRAARIAELRALLADIAVAQPCTERIRAFTRDSARSCCPSELLVA